MRLFHASLFVVAILSACAVSHSDSGATELEGSWSFGCIGSGDPLSNSFKFSGATYEFTIRYYQSDCTTLIGTFTQKGTFSLGAAVSAPAGAKKIDLTQSSLTVRIEPGMGGTTTCNGVTLTEGQEVDLAGKDCDGAGSTPAYLANGQVFYGVYALSGASFQFSHYETPVTYRRVPIGNSDANRPTSLQTTYVKQ